MQDKAPGIKNLKVTYTQGAPPNLFMQDEGGATLLLHGEGVDARVRQVGIATDDPEAEEWVEQVDEPHEPNPTTRS